MGRRAGRAHEEAHPLPGFRRFDRDPGDFLPDDLPRAADGRLHQEHGAADPSADARLDRGLGVFRRLLVGSPGWPRDPVRRRQARCSGEPLGALSGRSLQARSPGGGRDHAQDHPVSLRQHLRLMYSSGITILDAIRSSEEITGNMVIQEGLRLAGQQIGEGKNVTAAFQEVGLFPPLVVRMLRVGETTGALDKALLNVSYFYNREVRESIGKIQVIIEPALTVVLGVILGWVMLSVLGPIYDVISKIKV